MASPHGGTRSAVTVEVASAASGDGDPDAHQAPEVPAHDLGDIVLGHARGQVIDVAARLGEPFGVGEVRSEQDVVDAEFARVTGRPVLGCASKPKRTWLNFVVATFAGLASSL